jgi:hypothetical protein
MLRRPWAAFFLQGHYLDSGKMPAPEVISCWRPVGEALEIGERPVRVWVHAGSSGYVSSGLGLGRRMAGLLTA